MAGLDAEALDLSVRTRAFAFLSEQSRVHPSGVPRAVLAAGFDFNGRRVPLVGPQGIFKPELCRLPLSILTAPIKEGRERPYADDQSPDGLILYKYRGTYADRNHHENMGLREAMRSRIPLVYLYGLMPGWYDAYWPAYVVYDDPGSLTFTVALGEKSAEVSGPLLGASVEVESDDTRRWVTRQAMTRVHQKSFSRRVLHAYQERCAICRLGHKELLDAAHILPDNHPRGFAIVPNGLSLCRLHHAAFDANVLGVTPDLCIEIRSDVLDEKDGPMLQHGLQGFHGTTVRHLPHARRLHPRRDLLAERYEMFRKAG
jgi:putative restriction endonuclease